MGLRSSSAGRSPVHPHVRGACAIIPERGRASIPVRGACARTSRWERPVHPHVRGPALGVVLPTGRSIPTCVGPASQDERAERSIPTCVGPAQPGPSTCDGPSTCVACDHSPEDPMVGPSHVVGPADVPGQVWVTVHPHVRGACRSSASSTTARSVHPHVRGACPVAVTRSAGVVHPHVRGACLGLPVGATPVHPRAWARPNAGVFRRPVHPHVRGRCLCLCRQPAAVHPHVRGACALRRVGGRGLGPSTCVGPAPACRARSPPPAVHPHVRGACIRQVLPWCADRPSHVRGACPVKVGAPVRPVHPHVRGACVTMGAMKNKEGPSPRAWGLHLMTC